MRKKIKNKKCIDYIEYRTIELLLEKKGSLKDHLN